MTNKENKKYIKALLTMKKDKNYLAEVWEIDEGLNSTLPEDKDRWWDEE